MNNGVSMQPAAWGQVRVREPAGERVLGETLTIGGAGSDVVVPGVPAGAALSIRRNSGVWLVEPASGASVRFNGRPLDAERDLRREDVLSVGDAQVRVSDASRTLLKLSVEHLAGNVTIAPASALAAVSPADGGDEELEIEVPPALGVPQARARVRATRASAKWLGWLAAAAVVAFLIGRLGSVVVEVHPEDARVRAPGALSLHLGGRLWVSPGPHRVRAEREGYLPAEAALVVHRGGTERLRLVLAKLPGQLQIDTAGVVAAVSIDGVAAGLAPGVISVPAGDRTLSLRAPRYVDYTTTLGIEGAGARQELHVRLQPAWGTLAVTAVPQGAHVSVDGVDSGAAPVSVAAPSGAPRGQTPQSLLLPAVEHRIEVRKAGFIPFEAVLTPVPELERAVQYHLTPSDRGRALLESAPLIRSQIGYVLRLVPPGAFQMGSERREQGRRPNEGLRTVTLQRPFYIGVLPVTNGDFRRFRPEHASGYIDRQSIDLDSQPVTQVSWEDAAEFCNWLSHQDGLPPAYQRSGTSLALARPVTRGYRLPTEAEWEYAGRYGPSGESYRFAWGDSPPVPLGVGNLAGGETGSSLPATLPGYRDDYPVVSPVGKFHPTALGLHDMSGNVSQWVNDYYESFVDPAPMTDPLGPSQGTLHVVRGASWKTASVSELRLAWRDTASGPEPTVGFRLARYADDPQ